MVLLTINLLSSITYDYNNRPLFDIQDWRYSMQRHRSITSILIVYAHPVSRLQFSTGLTWVGQWYLIFWIFNKMGVLSL